MSAAQPVGAIDIGTNSTRVLVGVPEGGAVRTLARHMRITRLGQGVDGTGMLADDAVERTLDALRDWRDVLDMHGAREVRAVATSAARGAANCDDFFAQVQSTIGVLPELLSGEEEGRLSFLGATAGLDPSDGPTLVADIGGGSTELVLGTTEPEAVRSMDIGCVRITERYLAHDPPLPEELANALAAVEYELDDVLQEVPAMRSATRLIGLAGTVSAVAAVELGLASYDRDAIHHFRLTKVAVEDVFRTLATEALVDRVHNPGLERDRADVIVGGCIVLVRLLRTLGFQELLVSESDILDGLVLTQAT